MKESISNAFIMNVIITFIIVFILLMTASIAYSKAYKVKNRIVNLVEKYEGFENGGMAQAEIDQQLSELGYRVNPNGANDCQVKNVQGAEAPVVMNPTSNYSYCVVMYKTAKGPYYSITSYIYFDIPFMGTLRFPVTGETRIIYDEILN